MHDILPKHIVYAVKLLKVEQRSLIISENGIDQTFDSTRISEWIEYCLAYVYRTLSFYNDLILFLIQFHRTTYGFLLNLIA